MKFEDLSPELQEKARACTTGDEFVELAKAEGIELTDDILDVIAGGNDWYCSSVCPENTRCGMKNNDMTGAAPRG